MPRLRIGRDAVVGEFAHLFADRIQRVFEAAGADRRAVLLPDQLDKAGAALRGIAGGDEMLDRGRDARRGRGRGQAEIGQAHDLALAHRNAAEHLGEVFAGADPHQKFFDLAEAAGRPPAAAHRPRAGGWPRHRSRARPSRERHAARGRICAAPGGPRWSPGWRRRGGHRRTALRAEATASRSGATRSWPAGRRESASDMTGSDALL